MSPLRGSTARWRDALLHAMIPARGAQPALSEVNLAQFWARFEATAPIHLRLGLGVAAVTIGGGLPWAMGYGKSLNKLSAAQREAVITRAAQLPLLSDLLEIGKLVACLAYFADPKIQRHTRGEP